MEQQTQREQLSALADGELPDEEWAQALDFASTNAGRETWQLYQLVGDVLRSPELARQTHDDGAFLARLRQNLAQEPVHGGSTAAPALVQEVAAQTTTVVPKVAANDSVFRWKLVAGVASLATVASLAWSTWGGSDHAPTAGQWASSHPTPATAPVAAVASAKAPVLALTAAPSQQQAAVAAAQNTNQPAPPVMLRDPRLDELLAAHQQFHGASALQLPANFLRNANFESPKR